MINGLSGVGKLTIAKKIHRLLNSDVPKTCIQNRKANSTLLHNHLIIDLLMAIAPWKEPRTNIGLRNELTTWTMQKLMDEPPEQHTYIITGQFPRQPERQRAKELVKYINFAEAKGLPFFWFHIVCSNEDEHVARLQHGGRHHSKTKDASLLLRDREDQDKVQLMPLDIEEMVADYHAIASRYHTIDTAHRRPKDVAREIMTIVTADSGSKDAVSDPDHQSKWSKVRSSLVKQTAMVRSAPVRAIHAVKRPGVYHGA